MSNRSKIYIDGFNLYYGALRGTPYKWLDLQKYFTLLRQGDDIQKIWYFTALTDGNKGRRQQTYLKALRTTPLVGVQHGRYKKKTLRCYVPYCRYTGSKEYQAPEEKGTDVKIALQMLDDAYQQSCDRMIVVSGDEDLLPAVQLIKTRFPHIKVTVYIPARDPTRAAATRLRGASDKHSTLPSGLLVKAQFDTVLYSKTGEAVHKPNGW